MTVQTTRITGFTFEKKIFNYACFCIHRKHEVIKNMIQKIKSYCVYNSK